MLRIRFHGRGGHGTKTASRILGTAAYEAGFYAQDSPIYGAERRGAPVVAFARISDSQICERGIIDKPDLIVLADESLLKDPLAGVLVGQESASALFVNSDGVTDASLIVAPLVTDDLTTRSREVLGDKFTLSAGMAGAAAKMCGNIEQRHLEEAIRIELQGKRSSEEVIQQNIDLARAVFDAVPTMTIYQTKQSTPMAVVPVSFDSAGATAPCVVHPGTSALKNTGTWRIEGPVVDHERCTKCGLCVIYCPDGAMRIDRQGLPQVDYDHCKGCMICREICPPKCIATEKEVSAW
jgi:pyruvate ferredoxin oxidoreductase gamma subunit